MGALYLLCQTTSHTRKRRLEMVDILSQGYKTKDLYRQGKNNQIILFGYFLCLKLLLYVKVSRRDRIEEE